MSWNMSSGLHAQYLRLLSSGAQAWQCLGLVPRHVQSLSDQVLNLCLLHRQADLCHPTIIREEPVNDSYEILSAHIADGLYLPAQALNETFYRRRRGSEGFWWGWPSHPSVFNLKSSCGGYCHPRGLLQLLLGEDRRGYSQLTIPQGHTQIPGRRWKRWAYRTLTGNAGDSKGTEGPMSGADEAVHCCPGESGWAQSSQVLREAANLFLRENLPSFQNLGK